MHSGRLTGRGKTARLYRELRRYGYGVWCDAWELAREIETTSLATHISSIRDRLVKEGIAEAVEHDERTINKKRRQFYRVVRVEGYTRKEGPLWLEVQ